MVCVLCHTGMSLWDLSTGSFWNCANWHPCSFKEELDSASKGDHLFFSPTGKKNVQREDVAIEKIG